MSFDYETGVLIELCLHALIAAWALAQRASLLHANLRKIGYRQSFVTGAWKRGGSAWWELPVGFVLAIAISLLSWLGLAADVLFLAHAFTKNIGTPQPVRELRWRLRNVELSPQEVAQTHVAIVEAATRRTLSDEERLGAVREILSTDGSSRFDT